MATLPIFNRYICQRAQLIRSYYSGIGKAGVTYLAVFLVSVAVMQVNLGLVFFARDVFKATSALIGGLIGVGLASYTFGCLVVRPVFNRVLPRYLVVGSTLCASASILSMLYAPTLRWIFLLYGLNSLALSLFWPPLMAWLSTDAEDAALSLLISRYNLAWCVGCIIGPYICGWLSERAVHLPLLMSSSLHLLTAVFVAGAALVLPKVREDHARGTLTATEGSTPERSTLLRYPAWVGLFAASFAVGVIWAIFPIAAREELSLTKSTIGLLYLIRGLLNAITFIVLGRMSFWHFRRLPMLVSQLAGAAVFIGMAYTRSVYSIGVLFALFGICFAMNYSNSFFHGASGSQNRAQRMAIHESILAFGLMAGSVSSGIVYQAHTTTHAYWLCALIFFSAMLVQALLRGHSSQPLAAQRLIK